MKCNKEASEFLENYEYMFFFGTKCKMMPLVYSIYNGGQILKTCIMSLKQTLCHWILVIVITITIQSWLTESNVKVLISESHIVL